MVDLELRDEWQPKYILYIIDQDKPITITKEQRDNILLFMNQGKRFVQIGEYTIMVNSISCISPRYEPDNIPERPHDRWEYESKNGDMNKINLNHLLQSEWDSLFAKHEKAGIQSA